MRLKPATEAQIQRACLDYLKLRGIFCHRSNTGAARLPGRNGKPQLVRFGTPGAPDIVAIVDGTYWGIEVKRPGGRLSDEQRAFHASIRRAGGVAIVVRDVNELIRALEDNA